MDSYTSLVYLFLFLPLSVIAYNIFPQKIRRIVLLLFSYTCFFAFSSKLIVFLLFSTVVIYFSGLWLAKIQDKRDNLLSAAEKSEKKAIRLAFTKKQRGVVAIAVSINIGILLVLKYTAFFLTNVNSLFNLVNIPFGFSIPKFLMPIGISFYTLSAVSYIFDVYRGKIKAEKNFLRIALFLSFFPQIMEGPICRYSDTSEALWQCNRTTHKGLVSGLQRILFGLMKIVVVANRLNPLVETVYSDYQSYNGTVVFVAMIAYTCQLYMDFSGTMDIVIGTAEIFGVILPENFQRPFFSKTISEFWKRWHITLGTWFRDYIFYPLTTSKPLKNLTSSGRKKLGNHYGPLLSSSIALFCVWSCNGLWHGSSWSYIFFGMYHFIFILLGNIIEPPVHTICEKLHINRESTAMRIFSALRTTCIVCVGELFFRAHGLKAGMQMFGTMVSAFSFKTFADGTLINLGIDAKDYLIVLVTIIIVFVISLINEKKISVREWLSQRNVVTRWTICYALLLFIIIFGAYGKNYIPVDPIYANF